jgi:hypothetical protein
MTWDTLKHTVVQRRTLGAPPAPTATIDNLAQPETVPAHIDGRSLRATGRTEQLNVHVRPAFKQRIKVLAAEQDLLMAEVLERALAAYEAQIAEM